MDTSIPKKGVIMNRKLIAKTLFGIVLILISELGYSITAFSGINLKILINISDPDYINVPTMEKAFNQFFDILVHAQIPEAPLVIYLAGGPGASSISPIFLGSGPLDMIEPFAHNENFSFSENKWSWNKLANIVYLDQPRYTGFYAGNAKYVTSVKSSGEDFLQWLIIFYKKHPELAKRNLYLAGESFAGTYIAEYTHEILTYNQQNPYRVIPLKGVLIQSGTIGTLAKGNGATGLDAPAENQLAFLCSQNMLPSQECNVSYKQSTAWVLHSCIQQISDMAHIKPEQVTTGNVFSNAESSLACKQYTIHTGIYPTQIKNIELPNTEAYPLPIRGITIQEPANSLEFTTNSIIRKFKHYSPNPYNVSKACATSDSYPPWCYDGYKLNLFFNNPFIQRIIGQGLIKSGTQWGFASYPIAVALNYDDEQPKPDELTLYAEALQKGIKIIFAFGKEDYDINYVTAQTIANEISQKAYKKLIFTNVPANLPIKGGIETAYLGKMIFAQVPMAGHMIIYDQPKSAFTLLQWLLDQD